MTLENIKNLEDANVWYSEQLENIKNMDASDEYKNILLEQLNGTYNNMVNWFGK